MKNINKSLLVISLFFFLISAKSTAQWQQADNGLSDIFLTSFGVLSSTLLAGTNSGIYLTTDNGANWTATNNGSNNIEVSKFVVSGNNLFAVSVYKGVYISTDTGMNWSVINNGITEPSSVISIFASGSNLYAGTTNQFGIFLSTNNGTNWKAINNGLDNPGDIYSFAVLDSNLFVGTYYGGIFLTTDNGTNWRAVNKGLMNTSVGALAVSDTILFAGTGDGVYRSTNNGTDWTAINKGMANNYIISLAVSEPYIFAATGTKIYLSKNNGNNWTAVDSGLINTGIRSIIIFNEYLFVMMNNSGGIWKRSLSDMVVSVEESETTLLKQFNLEQNYPNPFNPTTNIGFRIAKFGLVTLKVYDVLGREVATLVNEEKPVGNYEVKFSTKGGSASGGNAYNLSSGIYFYELKAGSYTSVKKMILMK